MGTEDTGETSDETVINDNYAATIPARVRERIDVQPGDKLRWTATEDGHLRVEVVKQRYGVWEDAEPGHLGEVTEDDIDAMGVNASSE
ncbi:AbrB/MazE/SpoVT family DNA-binding domain-containing protein [Halegenticoccus soli]|uniref:AbrB/MazE/SpoVT family DNA-binding domain-containing protein n=1 Tax=Halegenticoccus soli TaxID=1985678 RepID=UPI000C6E6245|nr:AbrB/MazE/SpoVT family DNA-binding domain-containing protein [Halegenticoccus soli]